MYKTPILVVATTNRFPSLTDTVSKYYLRLLQQQQVPSELLSLTQLPPDITVSALYDNKAKNPIFNNLAEKMNAYHKFVWVVPQYNGSFPGVFKTCLDAYASPQIFKGKKGALVGLSKGSQGAIMALSHLTDIFNYLGMILFPMQPKLANIPDITLSALQAQPAYLALLQAQATEFIHF